MSATEQFPLRVEQIPAAALQEWRTGDTLPERSCDTWQLVYLCGGTIEEQCDRRTVTLRSGQLLFHQPGESWSMRAVGDLPPEVLRLDFVCSGTAMDDLRGRVLRTLPGEKICLQQLLRALRETFSLREDGQMPQRRTDPPFAAGQLLCIYLEILLIVLVRNRRRTRRTSARVRMEREQQLLVEMVELYFSEHLDRELTVEQICRDNGCSRSRLQKAFRARRHQGPMESFSRMKMERARSLLAAGYSPGETAEQLGFSDSAYFSRCFRRSQGLSPRDFARRARLAAGTRPATNRYAQPSNVHVTNPEGEVE